MVARVKRTACDRHYMNKEDAMRRAIVIAAFVGMVAAPSVFGQAAATRLFNFVDTPATITYGASGEGRVVLDPASGGVVSLAGFHKVFVRIGTTRATGILVNMGKISGATLSQFFARPMSQQTQTFDVIGPQMVLVLTGGPPNTTERVQLWVFLSS
jgi:hypothetical protein